MAKTIEEKKAAQAAAHKKWRLSQKGMAYQQRKKEKEAGVNQPPVNNDPPSQSS